MATIELHKLHKNASDNRDVYKLLKDNNIDVVVMDNGYYFLLSADVDRAAEIIAGEGYLLNAICYN